MKQNIFCIIKLMSFRNEENVSPKIKGSKETWNSNYKVVSCLYRKQKEQLKKSGKKENLHKIEIANQMW